MVKFEDLYAAMQGRITSLVKCYKIPLQSMYQHDDLVGEAGEAIVKCWQLHTGLPEDELLDLCSAAVRNRFRTLVRQVRAQKRDDKVFLREEGESIVTEGYSRSHYSSTPFDLVSLDEMLSYVRMSLLNLSRLHWDYAKEKISPSDETTEMISNGVVVRKATRKVLMDKFDIKKRKARTIERDIKHTIKNFYRAQKRHGSEEGALTWI